MEISEAVIRLSLRPRHITPSSIFITLHKIHVLSLLLLIIVSDLKLSNNAGSLECRLLRTFIFLTAADRILWGELSFDRVPTIWVLTTTFDNDYFKQPTLYYLEPFRNSQTKLMSRRFDRQVYFKHT